MPRPDDDALAAQAADETPPDASDDESDPSGQEPQAPPATAEEEARTLRDIQTAHGRQLADERRAREAAQAQVVALSQQVEGLRGYVQQVGSAFNQQQQQARAEYLRRLPPEQRLVAEHNMLKQEVAALRQGQAASRSQQSEQYSDAEIRDYMANRSRELVQEANDDFGLDGEEALGEITAETPGVDWTDETTFKRSVRKLARQRALGRGQSVADPKKTNDQPRGRSSDIGGRPLAARPASGGRTNLDVERETQRVFIDSRQTKGGIKARKEGLKAIQQKARDNLVKASR